MKHVPISTTTLKRWISNVLKRANDDAVPALGSAHYHHYYEDAVEVEQAKRCHASYDHITKVITGKVNHYVDVGIIRFMATKPSMGAAEHLPAVDVAAFVHGNYFCFHGMMFTIRNIDDAPMLSRLGWRYCDALIKMKKQGDMIAMSKRRSL